MPYTAEELEQLAASYVEWTDKQDNLSTAILVRDYVTDRAKEYAFHGLSRRLNTLRHCMDRTFESVPFDAENPTRASLLDASAFIQCFMINVYGAIDNIAHIWCNDAAIPDKKGHALNPKSIGLTPKNKIVRKSLSQTFQDYLAENDKWFKYLEDYRHSLAHRIPLYIPPRLLNSESQSEYLRLDNEKVKAISTHNWQRVEEMDDAMDKTGIFEPYIMHSFSENAAPIRFHMQMICDLATVV